MSLFRPTAPADVIVLRCALAIPTLIAMALNGAHAVHTWTRAYPLVVTVALWVLIPPLLPAAVHLVAVIGRNAKSATRPARWSAMAGALGVGGGAFTVSFVMQRDMILAMGVPHPVVAVAAPLLFDALAGMATVGLFMVNHSGQQQPVVRHAAQPHDGSQAVAADVVPAGNGPVAARWSATELAADITTDIDMRPEPASDVDTGRSGPVAVPEADHRLAVAQAVVEARSLKADVEAVVAVLDGIERGLSQSATAREAGVDRSTVKKVIEARAELPEPTTLFLAG